jgi:phosphoglycolate phosphatase
VQRAVIRGVIFDLDGTLLDSLNDIGGAMNDALTARGFPVHPIDAYLRMVGEGVDMLARRALPKDANVDLAQFIEAYRARYAERMERHTRPYDGIPALLDALTARGVKMAVLSNKREDFTVELVRRQLPRWPFVEVRGERSGVPRKPDPQAALALATSLGLTPADCAFVGDTPIDVKTAVNAGMLPVGVLWGFRTRDELAAAGARHTLNNPGELLALL